MVFSAVLPRFLILPHGGAIWYTLRLRAFSKPEGRRAGPEGLYETVPEW